MSFRICRAVIVVLIGLVLPAQASAQAPLLRSLAIPGTGQAQQGNYTKAALFAGAAIFSAVGLIVSSVQYNQAVDRFRQEKRVYLAYQTQIDKGIVVNIDDVNATYDSMQSAYKEADDREPWRDGFLIGLIATYSLNIIDVLISKPYEPEVSLNYQLEAGPERVLLTRVFRF